MLLSVLLTMYKYCQQSDVMNTIISSTCSNERAQIWSYVPKSSKKVKKNDDEEEEEEDLECVEVNYVYVSIVCSIQ